MLGMLLKAFWIIFKQKIRQIQYSYPANLFLPVNMLFKSWLWSFCVKNHRYLDLLEVLCVCDGVSIADNQRYITEVWLMKGGRVILLIDIVLIIKSFWRFINMFLFQVFVQVYILCDTFANSQKKKMFPATYCAT